MYGVHDRARRLSGNPKKGFFNHTFLPINMPPDQSNIPFVDLSQPELALEVSLRFPPQCNHH